MTGGQLTRPAPLSARHPSFLTCSAFSHNNTLLLFCQDSPLSILSLHSVKVKTDLHVNLDGAASSRRWWRPLLPLWPIPEIQYWILAALPLPRSFPLTGRPRKRSSLSICSVSKIFFSSITRASSVHRFFFFFCKKFEFFLIGSGSAVA